MWILSKTNISFAAIAIHIQKNWFRCLNKEAVATILLQLPIEHVSLTLMNPDADVRRYAAEYFSIRIWGIPFTLMRFFHHQFNHVLHI
ncbi:hypothetical protein EI200_03610 [Peribacillus simplex]|nr:hypothetical protein EI200_03610 [Peribacillus simplex]